MFETLQMKRFHVHDQVEFKETKRVPTALVDLFPRDSVVLTQHIKDTDEPKLEHPTPSSARTLKKTSMFEVDITPPKGKLITKKKKINKKCKVQLFPLLLPKGVSYCTTWTLNIPEVIKDLLSSQRNPNPSIRLLKKEVSQN